MKVKALIPFICAVMLAASSAIAQATTQPTEEKSATAAPADFCAADALTLAGKWDGFWSEARIDAVFNVSTVYAREGKCFLKFKLYQKVKEADAATYKLFEMLLRQGEKVDFDRQTVTRPTADIWGTIDKKAGKIVINHKRPELPKAGYAEFKKRI
jgi:hypothetical protein